MQFRFFLQDLLLLCVCRVFNGTNLKWRLYVLLWDKEYINNIWFASQHFKKFLYASSVLQPGLFFNLREKDIWMQVNFGILENQAFPAVISKKKDENFGLMKTSLLLHNCLPHIFMNHKVRGTASSGKDSTGQNLCFYVKIHLFLRGKM